ncbi:MAG: GNAT family N-acetyltransferase [Anaerolineae bacterium]|nr:GNAT family N-acetyltransferase [Anaerolineae bacterium]
MTEIYDFSSFPILRTERLTLRQLTSQDAEALLAIFDPEEARRFSTRPPLETREAAIKMINWFNDLTHHRQAIQWGITLHENERVLIGTCGWYSWAQSDRRVDIGYHIVPSQWGQGYATEATRAMLRWCFENLDLHRIQADCTAGHDASERVLLKCGFTVEGVWRESCWEHERFVDIKQFGLLRREFDFT